MTDAERTPVHHRVLRLVIQLVVLAVAVHLVLPQLAGLEATGRALARATWWLPVTVIALEAASLVAYGGLVRLALGRAGQEASRGLTQRIVLVGTSLGRTLPGGTTAAFAVVIGAFRRNGVDGVAATTAMGTSGLLSSIVLAALLPVGVAWAFFTGHLGGVALSAVLAAVVIVSGGLFLPRLLRQPDLLPDLVARVAQVVAVGPLRKRLDADTVRAAVRRGLDGALALVEDRDALWTAVGWAAANWLLDAGVAITLAFTLGAGTPVAAVLLAYVIAQIVAALPLTPGGVGVVEPAMIAVLVASGAPGGAATATVLGWRLISHWLPILVGLALYPTVLGGRTSPSA